MAVKNTNWFSEILLKWYATQDRPMPWKGEKNPYRVWLSEIILQQTQVAQGWTYYEKFCAQYPSVFELAAAPEDEVLKLWEGLGYYSRARNLHATAKTIVSEYQGQFPSTYEEILTLKGVGPYTAAAISSFAFDLPRAVVDGNVYRVLSRLFGITEPIDSGAGKKTFATLADQLLDRADPARYNQAIIDFGATQCRPKLPLCDACPFQHQCKAFAEQSVEHYPVKAKKLKKRTRYFNYIVLGPPQQFIIQQRVEKDIWQRLYEFPLIESEGDLLSQEQLIAHPDLDDWLEAGARFQRVSKPFQQQLTHQKIIARFWEFHLSELSKTQKSEQILVDRQQRSKFAFPKIIDWYLQDKSLYLELL